MPGTRPASPATNVQPAMTVGAILRAALLAALFAGIVTAVFHTFATEPVIDRAIALEEQHAHAMGMAEGPEVVSRQGQKAGLVLGYLLYGLAWGLLFAVAYQAARRFMPAQTEAAKALWVAAIAFVCVGLLPMLKYPANPPGVGDPDTIEFRQTMYLLLLGLSVVGGALSVAAARIGSQRGLPAVAVSAGVLMVVAIALLFGLPASPDAADAPADLLAQFRLLSVAGVVVFWTVFGVGFAWLISRRPAPRSSVASVTA